MEHIQSIAMTLKRLLKLNDPHSEHKILIFF